MIKENIPMTFNELHRSVLKAKKDGAPLPGGLTDKEQLVSGFREIERFSGDCMFTSCSHTCEKGCAVLKAANEGRIARSRIENYGAMYQEIKGVKKWEQKSKHV